MVQIRRRHSMNPMFTIGSRRNGGRWVTMKTVIRFLLLCLPLVITPLHADSHQGLRSALERNEIVPFRNILEWIEQHYVGRIVEVELEDDDDELIYEVDLLTPRGDVIEFEFDARSGDLKRVKGRDVDAARRR